MSPIFLLCSDNTVTAAGPISWAFDDDVVLLSVNIIKMVNFKTYIYSVSVQIFHALKLSIHSFLKHC